jgi:general secretion pathway protein K
MANEPRPGRSVRGSALIAVLWLVAALSAIAFALASTVRSETGRVTTAADGLKAYYLATGAVDRALLYVLWGRAYRNPDGSSRYYDGAPYLHFQFPSGQAVAEVIPELSKLNVNYAPPEELYQLAVALGAGPERARQVALGIVDWRTPALGQPDASPEFSLAGPSSFRPRHASFEEIEELLLVKGMTPELFYGTYERDAQGRLAPRRGMRDCLSVYGSTGPLDANTAEPAAMAAAGVPPDTISALLQVRRQAPILRMEQLNALGAGPSGAARLGLVTSSTFTIRATAQTRLPDGTLSDARRSVAMLVKLLDRSQFAEPYHVLRWYGNVWAE